MHHDADLQPAPSLETDQHERRPERDAPVVERVCECVDEKTRSEVENGRGRANACLRASAYALRGRDNPGDQGRLGEIGESGLLCPRPILRFVEIEVDDRKVLPDQTHERYQRGDSDA